MLKYFYPTFWNKLQKKTDIIIFWDAPVCMHVCIYVCMYLNK